MPRHNSTNWLPSRGQGTCSRCTEGQADMQLLMNSVSCVYCSRGALLPLIKSFDQSLAPTSNLASAMRFSTSAVVHDCRRSNACAEEPIPPRRQNRTVITPAVKTAEAAAEHDQPPAAPMTRQSSQALPKDKADILQTAEGSMPVPAEGDLAEPAPTCSLDGNDSSASGWGRKRPRGFRP